MFTNCCGGKKPDTKDAETQSDQLDLTLPNQDSNAIILQPAVKRQSLISDVKSEIVDDVFSEGVEPIPLAENLGTDNTRGSLPMWFSEDREIGGVHEPPATPIVKDDMALRRLNFFAELMSAAQNLNELNEHSDLNGPAGFAADSEIVLPSRDLEALVTKRLEEVTSRLENVSHLQEKLKTQESSDPKTLAMSVQGFQDIMQGPFAQYLSVSSQIGGDVATHSQMVQKAFQAQLQYLTIASQSKQPSQTDINNLVQPTGNCIMTIQEFREKNRGSQYFNHLSAISESIPALGWVAVSPAPSPYVKEMNDAGQFYTNRVLKDWKEKNKMHVDWVKAWVQTLTELQAFVKQHHTTGLVWGGKGSATAGVPPPPPGCPPPPPVMCEPPAELDVGNDRSALFAEINQGENITKSLKKVTADMQTHKTPTLRQGPVPFKAPAAVSSVQPKAGPVEKPPSFVRDGKKWLIEYQKGNRNLVVDGAEMNNVVYLFKCTDSTISVKGKINSITLDSCKKTSVVFESLVSVIEFINCQSVQMQVLGKVPTISIDKTDGCQMYLNNESLNVEIVSSKSSEMNVLVPKPDGEYVEYPVPEQYKTTVVPGKGLSTIIVENKG